MKEPKYRNSVAESDIYVCYTININPALVLNATAPEILEDLANKTILDLGCGFGSTAIELMKIHSHDSTKFIHMDADPRVFDQGLRKEGLSESYDGLSFYAKKENQHKAGIYDLRKDQIIVGDAMAIPLSDSSVDIVHSNYMFADNPKLDEERGFWEIDRVLKKGGLVLEGGGGPFETLSMMIEDRSCWNEKFAKKVQGKYDLFDSNYCDLVIFRKK